MNKKKTKEGEETTLGHVQHIYIYKKLLVSLLCVHVETLFL